VYRAFIATATSNYGWVAILGLTGIVAVAYVITLFLLATRTDRGFDGIKVRTPFFTITRERSDGSDKRRRPK
jgi:hypothetical protein